MTSRTDDQWGTALNRFKAPRLGAVFVIVCSLLLFFSLPAQAHSASVAGIRVPLTVPPGVPLRIILVKRVPIKQAGIQVEGKLIAPVYVYNRRVLPAGAKVLGHVAQVRGISRWRRAQAIMSGDFTPWRTAQVTFDAIVLKTGTRLPISTMASQGIPRVVRLESAFAKKPADDPISKITEHARQQVNAEKQQAMALIKGPDKIQRIMNSLKGMVMARLPYHRQAFPAGTEFTAQIQKPLQFGTESIPARELEGVGSAPPAECVVDARLMTPLNSATARRGMPVQAVVTQPLFTAHQRLIIPQGSRLEGSVIRAKPARWLHRDGSLRFTFRRLEPPASQQPEVIQASLQGVAASSQSNLKLDSEGGVSVKTSKTRYLMPALALTMAAWAATPDRDEFSAQAGAAAPSQAGALGQAVAGGWGLGLVGSVVSLAAQSRIISATLGFYGAAGSIYTNVIARGRDVAFPVNTPIEIRLGNHQRPSSKLTQPAASALPRRG
ncbi:MAG: hypothetical protein ACRD10_02295 [Terriglobia bacterium]